MSIDSTEDVIDLDFPMVVKFAKSNSRFKELYLSKPMFVPINIEPLGVVFISLT